MISMWTQWDSSLRPEKAITFRLPIPAAICDGTAWPSAFITAFAIWLPGQNRAMVGAGKTGLAIEPLGATMVIGRASPSLTGMWPVHRGIEQDRTDGEPDRDIDRAVEGHVDRPVGHLIGGAR